MIIDDAMIQGDAEALKNSRTIARQVIDRLARRTWRQSSTRSTIATRRITRPIVLV
jgi:hypothetical protein